MSSSKPKFQTSDKIGQDGIIAGNVYDKYGSSNPIVRLIMKQFETALTDFVNRCSPKSIHEIGCGEGYWVLNWKVKKIEARGSDVSEHVINIARDNAIKTGFSRNIFNKKSIYDLDQKSDSADLVVCCEVLEHLEFPEAGLEALQQITNEYLIVSVPREPLWRMLNILRGKYLENYGNTPGHIQHWTKNEFIQHISAFFEIVDVKSPIPWSMALCRPKK